MSNESKERKAWPNFWTERSMVKHPAFISLTGKAAQVLMVFRTKFQMEKRGRAGHREWVIVNDGEIRFTYREAITFGITNGQFTHAIDQLLDRGFMEVAQAGGQHRPTLYGTSEKWREWKPGMHFGARQPDRRAHKLQAARSARALKRTGADGAQPQACERVQEQQDGALRV
ncbi:MAG TPA: hypothetical protein VM141_09540 [Planctomycetota bacterium]|nr:hypothetical protein [Planctomycetota bacterium]